MKTGFSDPSDTSQSPKRQTLKKELSKAFSEYDNRCGRGVDLGTTWKAAPAQPFGHKGNPKERVSALPFGRVNTLNIYDINDID